MFVEPIPKVLRDFLIFQNINNMRADDQAL